MSPVGDDFDARLEALAARIGSSLVRAHEWIEPLIPATTGAQADAPSSAEHEALLAKLHAAESSANLQAQRCASLEDRVVELEAALVGARDERARAEARADAARAEADRALDQLEIAGGSNSERSGALDASLGEAFQSKLLEIERLTRERDALRRSSDEWRNRAHKYRRERDDSTLTAERDESQLASLRESDAALRRKLGELERLVSEQQRELDIAERRAKHLREHFRA